MNVKTLNKNTYPKSVGLALNSVGLHAKLGQTIPGVGAIIERFFDATEDGVSEIAKPVRNVLIVYGSDKFTESLN